MSELRIGWKHWVLVCDGARALFLRNDGDAELLNLIPVHTYSEAAGPTRDLGTDQPGKVHSADGTTRSAVEETDFHQQAEEDFLIGVARHLDAHVQDRTIEHLVVIAPPKALGFLRKHFSPAVQAIIRTELAKDLTKLSVPEIEVWLKR